MVPQQIRTFKKSSHNKLDSFDEINNGWNFGIFNSKKFVKSMALLPWDTDTIRDIKRKALLEIRPMMKSASPDKWASLNPKAIDNAINLMGEAALEDLSDTNTIRIDDYDLFIFDADLTIWDGPPGYKMEAPFKVEGDSITDSNGLQIVLKDGIREILVTLRNMGKDVGLISKSEKRGVDYQDQPVVLMLKDLGLLVLFNEMIVIDGDIPKSAFIPRNKRVIFIDDDIENLQDVEEHSNADAVNSDVAKFDKEDILDFENDLEPIEVIELREGETIEDLDGWAEDDNEILIPIKDNLVIRARIKEKLDPLPSDHEESFDEQEHEHMQAASNDWYKQSKRDYIPASERPDKPKNKKNLELDHKKPKNKGGSDKKDNLQWVDKDKHKKKSQDEGSFQDGGNKKVKHEKGKGEKSYHDYQKGCGSAKQSKDRKEMGEAAYSKQQSDIAKKRWNK